MPPGQYVQEQLAVVMGDSFREGRERRKARISMRLVRGKVNHLLRAGENISPNNSLLSQQHMAVQ
jgi:hypothetical protein